MKKLFMVFISMVAASVVFAHGTEWSNPTKDRDSGYWKNMDMMHTLMHKTDISVSKIGEGIKVSVTGSSDDTIGVIRKELLENEVPLKKYFQDVVVKIDKLDKGVELTFSSKDSKIAEQLQYYGSGLVYRFLQNRVHGDDAYYGHMGNRRKMSDRNWGHMQFDRGGMMGWNSPSDGREQMGR
jgi:hypothetical protein